MRIELLAGLISALAFAPAAALAQYYTPTDLGQLAGTTTPRGCSGGMNDNAIVVG
jgi:hypothetical protein